MCVCFVRGLKPLILALQSLKSILVVDFGLGGCGIAKLAHMLLGKSLPALKNISQEHTTACLRAGALMAVLSYLDFFSTGVQRVALSTATNMCKNLPSDAADFVMVVVPLLTSLLQYHDAKHASVLLNRIVEAFASSPDGLDEICIHGLVTQAAPLISTSIWKWAGVSPTLTTSTYTSLIRLISTCASGGSPLG
ncbi:E3 ubiquitin protein ligase UPL3 [Tanacetum coccineum]|uniref:HECT-type E3 ubiquitin transferase n=1 Tax=Tanacetum coccineum TaxID=301880 RepID=A0ABQ5CQJ6_9ASTR